jgi:hypothetical protein
MLNVPVLCLDLCLHAENSYYLIHCFDSLAQREQWTDLLTIARGTDIVLELDEVTLQVSCG